ncbi:class I SAM-dependent RNA methyltransferase [Allopusillimonas soli]|uniref:Class I SAM-dependent RNA methyltransferase n=1 Tax=Allopusillimonas soli TaxID=659016 RepID=A0A853FC38_9BURK|nr:THUMP domain-containing protein [Allopusillimonas soli]NYT35626.1 class I SAM-dependent RNA methyltransferase [Allopusillimonas soli]TEA76024.1 class I SAM-dependent RNA methyltransferase [Allopusillimonas soli]
MSEKHEKQGGETSKTLTLKNKPQANRTADGEKRKRAGARARQVARREWDKDSTPATPARPGTTDQGKRRAGRTHTEANEQAARAHPRAAKASARQARSTEAPSRQAPGGPSHAEGARQRRRAEPSGRAGAAAPRQNDEIVTREVERGGHAIKISRRDTDRQRRRGTATRRSEIHVLFASCPHGLEDALAAELQALGFEDAETSRAGCRFHTNWTGVLRANLYSRLATRILVQVAHGPIRTEDDIFALALDTPWEQWFGPEHTLRVDTSAIRSPMQSLQYCNLRTKDGICDRLREREGARPDIDTVRPDARVHLFLDESTATLYLDSSGESLFKRGWRLDKGEAPLRENLAAGLLALSGWDPARPLMDPFCGSGTILIEAAWIALGVPAGIWRPFGFERLRNHDARHWRDLKDEARSHIATRLETPLMGYDLDPRAVDAAKANLERAWLTPDTIRFETGDARSVVPDTELPGWVVSNPPYGERLPEDTSLWADWSSNLKQHYSGWRINVISSDLDLPKLLRLKPLRRWPLHNGALDCRLFSFDMVQAGYRQR